MRGTRAPNTEVHQRDSKQHSEVLHFRQSLMSVDEYSEVHQRDSQQQSQVLHFRQPLMSLDEKMMGLVLMIDSFVKKIATVVKLSAYFNHICVKVNSFDCNGLTLCLCFGWKLRLRCLSLQWF